MATSDELAGGVVVGVIIGIVLELVIGIPFLGIIQSAVLFAIGGLALVAMDEGSGSDTVEYTHKCPNCGALWNVNTGMNVIKFSENKYQCDKCNSTEYL